jgi:hypothetical protein
VAVEAIRGEKTLSQLGSQFKGERYVNPILRPRPLWFTVEVCKSVDGRCGRSGEI